MMPRALLLVLVSMGCSGGGANTAADASSTNPTTVSGTVMGVTLDARDAVAEEYLGNTTSPTANIIITNYPNACATIQASHIRPSSLMLDLALQTNHAAVEVRTYTFATGGMKAHFYQSDATCKLTGVSTEAAGSDGSVTITSVTDGLTGTFDVTLGTDRVTGSFHAPNCDPSTSPTITCGP